MEFTPRKQIIPSFSNGHHTPYSTGGQTHYKRLKKRINQSGSPCSSLLGRSPQTYSQRRFFKNSRAERTGNLRRKIVCVNEDAAAPEKKIVKSSPSLQSTKKPFSVAKEHSFTSYSSDQDTDAFDGNDKMKKRINQSGSPRSSLLGTYSQKRFKSTNAERTSNLPRKIACADEDAAAPEKKIIMNSPSLQTTKRPFSAVNNVECVKEHTFTSYLSDQDAGAYDGKKKHNYEKDPYNFCSNLDIDICDKRAKPGVDKENSIFNSPRTPAPKSYPSKKKQIDVSRSRLLADVSPEKVEKAYGPNYKTEAEKENVPAETTATGELLPLSEPTTTLPHLIGFPNYGNTCYLNSVVQALLGLSPFVGDLQMVSSQLSLPSTSLSSGLGQVIAARTKGHVSLVKQSLKTLKENLVRVDGSFSGYKMQDANEFLTRILDAIKDEIDRCHMTTPSPDRSLTCKNEGSDEIFHNSTKCQKLMNIVGKNVESEISIHSKDSVGEKMPSEAENESEHVHLSPAQSITPSRGCDEETMPRNPIKDNFKFQLFESYRCLGCNEVEGKKQEYFGLYVNLPEENHENIQNALSSCMGEDERELRCEKCGHNRSSVVTSVTRLPRILIVQLKRYEYKADQGESIKRSWSVPVKRWLSLDEYVSDASGPSLWSPHSGSVDPRASKQTTLTVRNLSSELNVCEGRKDQEELPVCSPTFPKSDVPLPTPDKEDEMLQEVIRRSMDDFGGTREEDEIQQAIRLSLQDLGMSYTQENQTQNNKDQVEEQEDHKLQTEEEEDEEVRSHNHAFRLISVISHFGCTTNTGHYVADVYNCEEESWFHYDDETVSKIPESVVLAEGRQKNGYIFFYVHKDVFQEIERKASLHR